MGLIGSSNAQITKGGAVMVSSMVIIREDKKREGESQISVWVCLMPVGCLIGAAEKVKSGHKSHPQTRLSPLNLPNSWATSVSLLLCLFLCIFLSLSLFSLLAQKWSCIGTGWWDVVQRSTADQALYGTAWWCLNGPQGLWFVWPKVHIR